MMRKIKRLMFALLSAVGMMMPGILLMTKTGGFRAILSLTVSFLFLLYVNIAPPTGNAGDLHVDTKRLIQLRRGSALILYAGLTFLPCALCFFYGFRRMSDWTGGKIGRAHV